MDNNITIDIEHIRTLPDHSVTDAETIRQIALYCIRNPGNNDLSDKIEPRRAVAGLYPEIIQSYNILPEGFTDEYLNQLSNQRK